MVAADDDTVSDINEKLLHAFDVTQVVQSIEEATGKVNVVPSPVTECARGPRKVLHYQPNVYYSPPIWKLSCSQLKCKQPECIATRSEKKTVFVRVYRYIGGKWVSTCEIVTYENHLDCKCKECKDIRNYSECIKSTTCPNCPFKKDRSNCFWSHTGEAISIGVIPLSRGNCQCCAHSGLCKILNILLMHKNVNVCARTLLFVEEDTHLTLCVAFADQ